jgi:proline iminopeptidase
MVTEDIKYIQLDNGYKVWTKRVGHGPIKILTLHGGPGCSHEYIKTAFEKVFSPDEFEIIYYDQLGSYNSDKPEDTSLWTVDRFCEEVEQVRKALNLEDFYLYGQSWGGMLAIEYALKYQKHLKGLILSNTPASIKSYEIYINELREQLPIDIQKKMSSYEKENDFDNPIYQEVLLKNLYYKHLCRLDPWPEAVKLVFEHFNEKVYQTMQGPTEFIVSGNYRNWNRWDDLSKINIPTLVISGRFDTINPEDTIKIAKLIPKAKVKICENGSHLSMYDDEDDYFKAIFDFFKTN